MKGDPLIAAEGAPELDREFSASGIMLIANRDGLLVASYAQIGLANTLRERFNFLLQMPPAVAPDRIETRQARDFDFEGDTFENARIAAGDGLEMK
ncbi:MAG: hypothetical protein L0312_09935 [Acidobacteria bacterium]|nr:hypothetical protein [Acidobacteriota bacterium]